jgi:simple sugar transport system ATP-binding protein
VTRTVPTTGPAAPPPALELRSLTKRFGGLTAVGDVSLSVAPGEVVALVGENGAGKSTLIQLACGLYRPDGGEVLVSGRRLPRGNPQAALAAGIGVIHQHFMLVGPLAVWENVVLGQAPLRPGLAGRLGVVDRRRARSEVAAAAERAGLALDVDAPVERLSIAAQQRVEIVKQLWRGARVLILDEPTAVLSPVEAQELLRTVRGLAAEGRSALFVSHKLREVLAVADRIAVLRRGRLVLEVARALATAEGIAAAVTGAEGSAAATAAATTRPPPHSPPLTPTRPLPLPRPRPRPHALPAPRLVARELEARTDQGRPALKRLSFEVAAGEILGIAGVDGNGQRELAELLCGLRPGQGTLALDGEEGLLQDGWARSPASARAAGVVHLPEDRHRHALCGSLTLEENLALGRQREPPWAKGPAGWLVDRAGRRARADLLLQAFDVRPPDPAARAQDLSGGNQQKLVAARELDGGAPARLVVAVQPSRGLDLLATRRVHEALLTARNDGAGVLLFSLDLDELRALADRILVLYDGRSMGLCAPETPDEDLGRRMLGQAAHGEVGRG